MEKRKYVCGCIDEHTESFLSASNVIHCQKHFYDGERMRGQDENPAEYEKLTYIILQ